MGNNFKFVTKQIQTKKYFLQFPIGFLTKWFCVGFVSLGNCEKFDKNIRKIIKKYNKKIKIKVSRKEFVK